MSPPGACLVTPAKLKRAAQKEIARRARANRLTPPAVKIREVCHAKQATLVESLVLSKARNICVKAGRQSGKSHGMAFASCLIAASIPGVNVIYVASTHATCKKMAFLPAVTINREHGLGGRPVYGAELAISYPNGSNVYFLGADSEKTVERLRGVPNLVLCVIDEASVYTPDTLAEMIKVVRPGLRPRGGKLCVMGTGSRQGQQGTWYDIGVSPEFEQHRFDYRDNDRVPTHANVEQIIDEDLKAQFPELTSEQARQTAWFQREYLGLDVVELAEMVYKLTEANLVDALPDDLSDFSCATGGDIGVDANDALVCGAWPEDALHVWIVDQEQESGQDSIACADMVSAHNAKRHPLFIALDPGGLGVKTIKTVQNMYPDVPVVEAQKPPVGIQVRAVNTLLQGGRLKILRGSKLALELVGPTWVDGIVGGKIDEHGRHSDLVPGLRYLCVKLLPLLPDATEVEAAVQRAKDAADPKLQRLKAAQKRERARQGNLNDDDMEEGFGGDGDDFEPVQVGRWVR